MKTIREMFEILADGKTYIVNAISYLNGNEELRYRVSVNNSPVFVFGWNDNLNRYAVMHDTRNPQITSSTETAIAGKLENLFAKKQAA